MKKILLASALIASLSLTGCAAQNGPKPNPTLSAKTDKFLSTQTDEFAKVALENLRKATPVLSKTEAEAMMFLDSIGLTGRVVKRDGEGLVVDASYSNSRIDLVIESNIVVDFTVG